MQELRLFTKRSLILLQVTFLMMPLEIGWASTVSWYAGDAMCRIMMFFRMFGLYLSSFILVCISVDRYFLYKLTQFLFLKKISSRFYAVLKPLYLRALDRRDKLMLIGAWMGATLCSIPQVSVSVQELQDKTTTFFRWWFSTSNLTPTSRGISNVSPIMSFPPTLMNSLIYCLGWWWCMLCL